ncbi:Nitroreductase [Seminavis robusta]|uniref:Nitroreductase n=1 Tax=Seminavis robusta TaxID=568900 RepID=A0A9N8H0H2_9STRA|nr:Nitroreductase [Seminavis robusta]|eukprot:Sro2_g001420.1 Nitroreductase (370) ;mRNA; r:146047-147231
MNTSNAFRSHLMQQFASAARSQSRPPLALIPWIRVAEEGDHNSHRRQRPGTSNASGRRSISTRPGRTGSSNSSWSSPSTETARRPTLARPSALSSLSLSSLADEEEESHHDRIQNTPTITTTIASGDPPTSNDELNSHENNGATLAHHFQTLIQTRRTTSHFGGPANNPENDPLAPRFWIDALDRAVECGRRAPNHKRTERFSFKRMIAPSPATERLAEIAYHVTLQKPSATEQTAEKKQAKWSSIPAFLVATVQSESQLHPDNDNTVGMYQALPFVPPQTEREMEDYAAACAAVQNVLLSLHAENIASKWATGPVIQSPAFRELVGATANDRIVALVMIGLPKLPGGGSSPPRPRRFRRDWQDFLQDV